jgi:hypothetical protein
MGSNVLEPFTTVWCQRSVGMPYCQWFHSIVEDATGESAMRIRYSGGSWNFKYLNNLYRIYCMQCSRGTCGGGKCDSYSKDNTMWRSPWLCGIWTVSSRRHYYYFTNSISRFLKNNIHWCLSMVPGNAFCCCENHPPLFANVEFFCLQCACATAYDKLAKWKFRIHGGIDGASHFVVWYIVATDKLAVTIF